MSALGEAASKGLAKRIENTLGGSSSKADRHKYANIQEMLEVAGIAAVTYYWNRAQKNTGGWRFGELVLAPLIGLSAQTGSGISRVATGVFTGALIDLITSSTGTTASVTSVVNSMGGPIKEVTDW